MKDSKKLKEKMTKLSEAPDVESDDAIDPGFFRELDELVSSETQEQIELLSLMDVAKGDNNRIQKFCLSINKKSKAKY